MLKIQNHKLVGNQVSFRQTPNIGSALRPRFLVLHYTAGRSLDSSVESLCTRKPQGNASAHLAVGRDGRIVQMAAFNVVTWHAGISQWNGLTGLNAHTIGIEMDNAGKLHREGDRYVAWFGKDYPNNEVRLAEHRHGGGVQPWHTYSEIQIERTLELCEALVAHYGLEDVLGHEDISRGRKTDPGPAFPLDAVRSRALGRGADEPVRLVVTASSLNIRGGPGAQFDKVAPPLGRGTVLQLLEPQDRWSRVSVVGPTDVEGWVSNDFVVRADAEPAGTRAAPPASRGAPPLAVAQASPKKAKKLGKTKKVKKKAKAKPKASSKTSPKTAIKAPSKTKAKAAAKTRLKTPTRTQAPTQAVDPQAVAAKAKPKRAAAAKLAAKATVKPAAEKAAKRAATKATKRTARPAARKAAASQRPARKTGSASTSTSRAAAKRSKPKSSTA